MRANLMLNGDSPKTKTINRISDDFTLCADGAFNWCKQNDIKVDLLIGDCDSVTEPLGDIERIVFDSEKNETDGELALLYLIENGYNEISIYGAVGGREDHMLANFGLLIKASEFCSECKIITDNFDIYLCTKSIEFKAEEGLNFSIAPFCDELHILNITGAKYETDELYLKLCSSRGISNVGIGNKVEINVKKGEFLLFISN